MSPSKETSYQGISITHRYPNIFHGYCYICNNYGHNAMHYKENDIYTPVRKEVWVPPNFSVLTVCVLGILPKIACNRGLQKCEK